MASVWRQRHTIRCDQRRHIAHISPIYFPYLASIGTWDATYTWGRIARQVFLTQLSQKVGREISFGDQTSSAAAAASTSRGALAATGTVEEMQDPVIQAEKAGFKVGAIVMEKRVLETAQKQHWISYRIEKYDGTAIVLLEQRDGEAVGDPRRVQADDIRALYKLRAGAISAPLYGWRGAASFVEPLNTEVSKVEVAKAAVQLGIYNIYKKLGIVDADLALFTNPSTVRPKSEWPAGKLTIVPATFRVDRREGGGSLPCGVFDLGGGAAAPLYIAPCFSSPKPDDTKAKEHFMPAFWFVPGTPHGKKATLTLKVIQEEVLDFTVRVPVLTNPKAVGPSDELHFDKATGKALQGRYM